MFATRRRSFGSPTRAEALVLGQNCASLVTKITIFNQGLTSEVEQLKTSYLPNKKVDRRIS